MSGINTVVAAEAASASCEACANPTSGLVMSGCRGCTLREIARGPNFWNSRRAQKLTPEYCAEIMAAGVTHDEVKAAAKRLLTGAVPA